MRRLSRWLLALGWLTMPCTAESAPGRALVRFANDDCLAGNIDSLGTERLVLDSDILARPTPFFLEKVLEVGLTADIPNLDADHEAVVTLTNGDVVRGQLAAVTDEIVSIDTWYAGRLDFNRLMVSGLRIEPCHDDLFRGPVSLDGWVQSGDPGAWVYRRLALVSGAEGGIARPDVLPDECSVRFDVDWKSDSLHLKIILLSDDPETDHPESGYELSIQRRSVYLRNCSKQRYLGSSSSSRELRENTRARIELRASAKNGRFMFLVNDKVIETWTDPDVGDGRFGRALHFVAQNANPLRISNLRVGKWDGEVDESVAPRVPGARLGIRGFQDDLPDLEEKPADTKRMELANSDSISGEVKSIADGMIAIETTLGEITVPVSRFRNLALKPVEQERAILRNGDIRAWFPDGSSMVFRLDSVEGGRLVGSSQNFGTAEFDMAAFSRIEFNIHNFEYKERRRQDEW